MPDLAETGEHRGSLEDFLSVVFRRIWILVAAVGVTVVAMLYVTLTSAPIFESSSKVLVSRGQQTSAFAPTIKVLSWEEELSSELETIRSARIYLHAQKLLDARGILGADGEPFQIEPRGVDASTPGKSSVIYIRYKGEERDVARPVVQALTQAYREFRTQGRTPDPTGYLQQEIDGLQTEIAEWERRRAEFLINEGAVQVPEERTALLDARRIIGTNLASATSRVAEQESQLEWMRSLVAQAKAERSTTSFYTFGEAYQQRGEPVLQVLQRRILDTKTAYFAARAQYTESHPTVLAFRDELEDLQETLWEEADAYAQYLDARLSSSRAQAASLAASLDFVNSQLSAYPDREAQLGQLDRTIETLKVTHSALVRRKIDAVTTRVGSNPWDVVVLQEASEPYVVRTRDYVRLGIIPIFSLLLGLGLAFLFDSLDHSLKDRAEAEAHLKLPVLASVSRFRK